jgi:hypothetical protein
MLVRRRALRLTFPTEQLARCFGLPLYNAKASEALTERFEFLPIQTIGTQLGLRGFPNKRCIVVSTSKSKKRQKSERDLESHYGAVRIKAVAGVLDHHRNSDTSSHEATTKSSSQKRSVLEGIGRPVRSTKSKGRHQ